MEKQISLTLEQARRYYDESIDLEFKQLLEDKFGKNNLFKYTIQDITYERGCELLGVPILKLGNFEINYQWYEHQLAIIIRACNYIDNDYKIWTPNFSSSDCIYRVWIEYRNSRWAFLGSAWCDPGSCAPVWLYFKNKNTADYIGKNKLDLYRLIF